MTGDTRHETRRLIANIASPQRGRNRKFVCVYIRKPKINLQKAFPK